MAWGKMLGVTVEECRAKWFSLLSPANRRLRIYGAFDGAQVRNLRPLGETEGRKVMALLVRFHHERDL